MGIQKSLVPGSGAAVNKIHTAVPLHPQPAYHLLIAHPAPHQFLSKLLTPHLQNKHSPV